MSEFTMSIIISKIMADRVFEADNFEEAVKKAQNLADEEILREGYTEVEGKVTVTGVFAHDPGELISN